MFWWTTHVLLCAPITETWHHTPQPFYKLDSTVGTSCMLIWHKPQQSTAAINHIFSMRNIQECHRWAWGSESHAYIRVRSINRSVCTALLLEWSPFHNHSNARWCMWTIRNNVNLLKLNDYVFRSHTAYQIFHEKKKKKRIIDPVLSVRNDAFLVNFTFTSIYPQCSYGKVVLLVVYFSVQTILDVFK